MSEEGEIGKKISFILEKYALDGKLNPELALEHDVRQKMEAGRTREQAIDELYDEKVQVKPVKQKVTVKDLQKTVEDEKNKLTVVIGGFERLSKETSSVASSFEQLLNEIGSVKRNSKIMLVSCISLAVVVVALLGTSFFQPRELVATPVGAKAWHEVRKFQGYDDSTTSIFRIPSESWRITWGVQPYDPRSCIFGFMVYPENTTEDFIYIHVLAPSDFEMGLGEYWETQVGIEYLTGQGDYYAKVITSDEWFILVESYD